MEPGELLIFFSGAKGFHIGIGTGLWSPAPSSAFAKTARRFAEHVAELAAVTIDSGVYDKVRAFRAPNSKHPKTGLHKRRLTPDELAGPLAAIVELAAKPAPFDVPQVARTSEAAAADWQAAADQAEREGEAKAARRATGNSNGNGSPSPTGSPTLNKGTMLFIREGRRKTTGTGSCSLPPRTLPSFIVRRRWPSRCWKNPALDCGLPPKDVRHGIECGLSAIPSPLPPVPMHQDATESTQGTPDGSAVNKTPEAATSDSGGFDWQAGRQVTTIPDAAPAADLQADLAKLWQSTSTPAPTDAAGVHAGRHNVGTVRRRRQGEGAARIGTVAAAAGAIAARGRRLGDARQAVPLRLDGVCRRGNRRRPDPAGLPQVRALCRLRQVV